MRTDDDRPTFFDMPHSNNAARIRLWLTLSDLHHAVRTVHTTYDVLRSDEYASINPMRKVPALIGPQGKPRLFESAVILNYLEDEFGAQGAMQLVPSSAIDRAHAALLVRVHDLYIASPNASQPGFSHTQGCMYLPPHPTADYAAERTMDRPARAAKLAEIWKQLGWLESTTTEYGGAYLGGAEITHADLTWFPTAVFMEYMLPRVFGWCPVFRESTHFPALARWFAHLEDYTISAGAVQQRPFADVRATIWAHWERVEASGHFDAIRREIDEDNGGSGYKWAYP